MADNTLTNEGDHQKGRDRLQVARLARLGETEPAPRQGSASGPDTVHPERLDVSLPLADRLAGMGLDLAALYDAELTFLVSMAGRDVTTLAGFLWIVHRAAGLAGPTASRRVTVSYP